MIYTNDPREIEDTLVFPSFAQIRDAFWQGFANVFEDLPANRCLAVLLAHSALETGRWVKGLHCWNVGNVKASASYAGNIVFFRCNELIKGKYEWFDPPHPQTRFRAYKSAAAGAEAHLRFLGTASNPARGNRYGKAWDAALDGDPGRFVDELHRAGYFTAHLTPYRNAVVSLFREYMTELKDFEAPELGNIEQVFEPVDAIGPGLHEAHEAEGTPLHSAFSAIDMQALIDAGMDAVRADKLSANLEMP